jgi:hypothetical protein
MPPELDRIITTCLAKNPDERYGCAHDLKLQLRIISEAKLPAQSDQPEEIRNWTRASWPIAAVCALAAIVLAGVSLHFAAQHPPLFRSYLLPPGKTVFVTMTNQIAGPPVVSPDGSKLAFVARDEQSKTMLYVQPLDALAAQPLAGTEGATYPFWSADSRSIGFFPDASKLKRIDVSGGPPQTVCENFSPSARGGAWNATGTMLFGFGAGNMPLQRVSAAGGVPAPAAGFEDQENYPALATIPA